ncbi:protein VACUOLELESS GAMETOPHYTES-like [Corylus avellana]|uniref:protein VACUOLELESS GAMETOPHYTES-like n=1 Tax=Corylus avellana TaxID=13451 RepID=UPI00286B71EA|nr:protein VACUOLELESS GAMETOPHYTES-like [Corylus avellana]
MEEIQHFSHEEHPLMFVEEFENDDEEIQVIVCSGCDQSIYAPAYKCSHCNFFLHKSCAELPPEIQHHLHPNHTLVLVAPSNSRLCDACRRDCERCFAYRCHRCNFDLDIACASGWRTNPDDCHQHEFVPIFQHIHFTCELCGDEDRNSAAQVCRICQLLAHYLCTLRPRTIKIMADRHLLTLIHSPSKVIKEHHDLLFCNLCYKQINLNYAGYYCQLCDFIAHLKCAQRNSIGTSSDTKDDSSIEEEGGIDFEEGEELEELKHFHHEHNLFLSRNQVEVHHEHKLCEGCVKSISAPIL